MKDKGRAQIQARMPKGTTKGVQPKGALEKAAGFNVSHGNASLLGTPNYSVSPGLPSEPTR